METKKTSNEQRINGTAKFNILKTFHSLNCDECFFAQECAKHIFNCNGYTLCEAISGKYKETEE